MSCGDPSSPNTTKPIWTPNKMMCDHSFQHYCETEITDLKTPVRRERSTHSNKSTGTEGRGEVKTLHGTRESKAQQKPGKSAVREQTQLPGQGLVGHSPATGMDRLESGAGQRADGSARSRDTRLPHPVKKQHFTN